MLLTKALGFRYNVLSCFRCSLLGINALGVLAINTNDNMKIREFAIAPSKLKDTTSCDTTYSGQPTRSTQDIVPHDLVPEMVDGKILEQPDHSAITEGVSQILRRVAGKGLRQGFRCTSGPRKGRIVAKPSTCFAKRDPMKGAKIKKKRMMKARQAGKRMGITKRSKGVSRRLKTVQTRRKTAHTKYSPRITSRKPLAKSGGKLGKSKVVKRKK